MKTNKKHYEKPMCEVVSIRPEQFIAGSISNDQSKIIKEVDTADPTTIFESNAFTASPMDEESEE